VEPPSPGDAAALPASGRAAAKRLLMAQVHSGRLEGLRLEEPLCGFSPVIGRRGGSILSIPRSEQWMVQPYIQPMRPQPLLPGRTPRLQTRLPRQRHRRVPGPMLPSEQASTIPPLQQQAFSCVFPRSAPMQRLRPNCGCSKEALGFRRRQSRNPAKRMNYFFWCTDLLRIPRAPLGPIVTSCAA
jgi:hypothetical protein